MSKKLHSVLLWAGLSSVSFAGSVTIEDFNFSLLDGPTTITSGTYAAFWGTYSGTTFTPFALGNQGYTDMGSTELLAIFSRGDNVGLTFDTPLALSITLAPEGSAWSSALPQAVLIDPLWKAPTFTTTDPSLFVNFSAQTSAIVGNFSFNGGNEIINVAAVPEPSAFAALAGFAALGFVALRRRR